MFFSLCLYLIRLNLQDKYLVLQEVHTFPYEHRAVVTFQHARDAVVCRRKFHRFGLSLYRLFLTRSSLPILLPLVPSSNFQPPFSPSHFHSTNSTPSSSYHRLASNLHLDPHISILPILLTLVPSSSFQPPLSPSHFHSTNFTLLVPSPLPTSFLCVTCSS